MRVVTRAGQSQTMVAPVSGNDVDIKEIIHLLPVNLKSIPDYLIEIMLFILR